MGSRVPMASRLENPEDMARMTRSFLKTTERQKYEANCNKIKALGCFLFAIVIFVAAMTLLRIGVFKL